MTIKPLIVSLGLGTALASSAQAEGWTVTDFSSISDRETCMAYAETTFATYRERYDSPGFTGVSTWTVGGYDLSGDVIDGLFICPDEGGAVAPFLVVYNTDEDTDTREVVSDRVADIWDEVVAGNGVIAPAPVAVPAPTPTPVPATK